MVRGVLTSLAQVFAPVEDFRCPRGRRYPLLALLTLVFLVLLALIREMAVLQRWTEDHWEQLREPLGFTPPGSSPCHHHQPRPGPLLAGRFRASLHPVAATDDPG